MQTEASNEGKSVLGKPWVAWLFWTVVVVAVGLLCLPGAEALGLPVVWGLTVPKAGGLVEGAITAAVIGLAQWLVMRFYLPKPDWWLWIIATALGLVLGIVLVAQSRPYIHFDNIVLDLMADGVIIGIAVGLCQWLALQPYVRWAILWWPATILGLAPFFAIKAKVTLEISMRLYDSSGAIGSLTIGGWIGITAALLVYGSVTGLVFAFLVRKAVWTM